MKECENECVLFSELATDRHFQTKVCITCTCFAILALTFTSRENYLDFSQKSFAVVSVFSTKSSV